MRLFTISGFVLLSFIASVRAEIRVASLAGLAAAASGDGRTVVMEPGVYPMADYLTPAVLGAIKSGVDRTHPRPPVPMMVFSGSDNRFDLRGVVIEIDTGLYAKLPQGGYTRCLIIAGSRNRFDGLSIRMVGGQRGSGGNTLSIAGEDNTLENITLHVHGSHPFGYGDLLGKGGPNLVTLQKQSGIQILGARTLLRRCRVVSRAFGHCFYIQGGDGSRLEDCYAEGVVRSTTEMLKDRSGPAFELGFKSVYPNRDGRHLITPGYMKSLVEDGFRTYGNAGVVTLLNCVAINTRAGFEIMAPADAKTKTLVQGATALGCERGFLIGANTLVRDSRGDAAHGPLLYLRGGSGSEVELELTGPGPEAGAMVHALATIAGENHRVKLTRPAQEGAFPALPVMFGYGMPEHAEMASPILPAPTKGVRLVNEIADVPVILAEQALAADVVSKGRIVTDEAAHRLR